MNIFISHSSLDKWVARRISQDLEALGVTTFLDEKDIETGESIDDTITQHLRDCDELLLVLSPAALQSQWVLIEVGGAKALGKRLVPILLHVAPNEIPQPISKHLARDINDIEMFYDEVKTRLAAHAPPPEPEPRPKPPAPVEFAPLKLGEKVRVIDGSTLSAEEKDRGPKWVLDMDDISGREGVVLAILRGSR